MRLTTRGHYSIKALLDLALQSNQSPRQPIPVRAIAERQQIPPAYLEKLLIELRQAGLVKSARGAQGGYRLARPPKKIPLAEILAAVGEQWHLPEPTSPVLGPAEDWVTQALWRRVSHQVQQVLEHTTLEDLYFDARSWQAMQTEDSGFVV